GRLADGGGGRLMEGLVLNGEQVAELLPMPECIKVMRDALAALARGEALVPLRTIMRVPGVSGFLGLMPGYISPRAGHEGGVRLPRQRPTWHRHPPGRGAPLRSRYRAPFRTDGRRRHHGHQDGGGV